MEIFKWELQKYSKKSLKLKIHYLGLERGDLVFLLSTSFLL